MREPFKTRFLLGASVIFLLVCGLTFTHLTTINITSAASQQMTPPPAQGIATPPAQGIATPPAQESIAPVNTDKVVVKPTKSFASKFSQDCGFTLEPIESPQALGQCTILVIGDSMASNLGWGLSGVLKESVSPSVILKGKPSTGLSNSWFYDWSKELPPMLEDYKPSLVIMFIGANDVQDSKIDSKSEKFGNEKWLSAYASKVKEIESLVSDSGAYLMWVGLPIMRPNLYEKGISQLSQIQESNVVDVPGAVYLPLRTFLADAQGNYRAFAKVNNKMRKIRGEDGIHFSSIGQSVIATYVLDNIEEIFHTKIHLKNRYPITN